MISAGSSRLPDDVIEELSKIRHRRQTETRLVAGGFVLLALVGGGLLWLFYGWITAAIAIGVIVLCLILFGGLFALLRLLERWANG